MPQDRYYRGKLIRPCGDVAHKSFGSWLVQWGRMSGAEIEDGMCPHFRTLAEAKAGVDEMLAY